MKPVQVFDRDATEFSLAETVGDLCSEVMDNALGTLNCVAHADGVVIDVLHTAAMGARRGNKETK